MLLLASCFHLCHHHHLRPDFLFLIPGSFDGRPADYIFMLLFNWICIVVSFQTGNSCFKISHFNLPNRKSFFHHPATSLLACFPLYHSFWPLLHFSFIFSLPLSRSLQQCAMSGWLCASGPVSVCPCRAEKPNLGHMLHQQYTQAHISALCLLVRVQLRLGACCSDISLLCGKSSKTLPHPNNMFGLCQFS